MYQQKSYYHHVMSSELILECQAMENTVKLIESPEYCIYKAQESQQTSKQCL